MRWTRIGALFFITDTKQGGEISKKSAKTILIVFYQSCWSFK